MNILRLVYLVECFSHRGKETFASPGCLWSRRFPPFGFSPEILIMTLLPVYIWVKMQMEPHLKAALECGFTFS